MSTPPDTPSDSDTQLVQRTLAGDQRAFELLVIKYQRRVERLIGRMVRDVDLVPDIAQETFIRAYRALAQFRGDAQFYTWLYHIAVNTAKKALVALKRDPVLPEHALQLDTDADETSARQPEPTTTETPETELAARELAAAVNAAMEALPEDLRQAVTLREIEGLSYEEIAAADALPHRHRALAHLPRPRGHFGPGAATAGAPDWQALVARAALRRLRRESQARINPW